MKNKKVKIKKRVMKKPIKLKKRISPKKRHLPKGQGPYCQERAQSKKTRKESTGKGKRRPDPY